MEEKIKNRRKWFFETWGFDEWAIFFVVLVSVLLVTWLGYILLSHRYHMDTASCLQLSREYGLTSLPLRCLKLNLDGE